MYIYIFIRDTYLPTYGYNPLIHVETNVAVHTYVYKHCSQYLQGSGGRPADGADVSPSWCCCCGVQGLRRGMPMKGNVRFWIRINQNQKNSKLRTWLLSEWHSNDAETHVPRISEADMVCQSSDHQTKVIISNAKPATPSNQNKHVEHDHRKDHIQAICKHTPYVLVFASCKKLCQ